MSSSSKKSVLFICLGNICRSPMAEAIFVAELEKRKLRDQFVVDSGAVIDYHVGKTGPEPRASEVLKRHGIEGFKHKVRQVTSGDFEKFDYIFGMDEENISDLKELAKHNPKSTAKIDLFGKYDPTGKLIIVDPYYESGLEMFETVFEDCTRATAGFLASLGYTS